MTVPCTTFESVMTTALIDRPLGETPEAVAAVFFTIGLVTISASVLGIDRRSSASMRLP